MKRHGGRCIDLLTAFNGTNGTNDAYKSGLMNKVDCCYPSGKGQQLVAQILLKTGLAPLRRHADTLTRPMGWVGVLSPEIGKWR